MIRTVITPNNQTISFGIPKEYVGKQVEVIAFTEDEGASKERFEKKKIIPKFGSLKGKIHMSPDFDEPLDDFKEYI